ncbi:MAG: recombinase zinc beta ribbon domain-containing protein [Cyanobacteria bacterium P01_G01_bin.54]
MNNPVLRGHTCYLKWDKKRRQKSSADWEWHYDTHPEERLLSEEEYTLIQDHLAHHSKSVRSSGEKFYLTGLTVCDVCGSRAVLKRNQQYVYYGCRHSGVSCDNRGCIQVSVLEQAVVGRLHQRALAIREGDATVSAVVGQQQSELASLQQQREQLTSLVAQYPESNGALKQTLRDLEQQIQALEQRSQLDMLRDSTAEELIRLPEAGDLGFWFSLSLAERELIYPKLV